MTTLLLILPSETCGCMGHALCLLLSLILLPSRPDEPSLAKAASETAEAVCKLLGEAALAVLTDKVGGSMLVWKKMVVK